jgi:hypothetical protein
MLLEVKAVDDRQGLLGQQIDGTYQPHGHPGMFSGHPVERNLIHVCIGKGILREEIHASSVVPRMRWNHMNNLSAIALGIKKNDIVMVTGSAARRAPGYLICYPPYQHEGLLPLPRALNWPVLT